MRILERLSAQRRAVAVMPLHAARAFRPPTIFDARANRSLFPNKSPVRLLSQAIASMPFTSACDARMSTRRRGTRRAAHTHRAAFVAQHLKQLAHLHLAIALVTQREQKHEAKLLGGGDLREQDT
jgi:hypothetical protein